MFSEQVSSHGHNNITANVCNFYNYQSILLFNDIVGYIFIHISYFRNANLTKRVSTIQYVNLKIFKYEMVRHLLRLFVHNYKFIKLRDSVDVSIPNLIDLGPFCRIP